MATHDLEQRLQQAKVRVGADLLKANSADQILYCVARVWWLSQRSPTRGTIQCPKRLVPKWRQLQEWVCTTGRKHMSKVWDAYHKADVAPPAWSVKHGKAPDLYSPDPWPTDITNIHAAWVERPSIRHPLADLVAAYIKAEEARPVPMKHARVRQKAGTVKTPYALTDWFTNRDAELRTTNAGITHHLMAVPHVEDKDPSVRLDLGPRVIATLPPPQDRLFPPQDSQLLRPNSSLVSSVAYQALMDHTNTSSSLPSDCAVLLMLAMSAVQPLWLTPFEGAQILARRLDGGFRYPLKGDMRRFDRAMHALGGLSVIMERDPGRWRPLVTLDYSLREGGRYRLHAASWIREQADDGRHWGWTLSGGISAQSSRRMSGKGSPLFRLICAFEAALTRTNAAPGSTVAAALVPADTSGRGPRYWVPWDYAMLIAGERRLGKSRNALRRIWQRRVELLHKVGYTDDVERRRQLNRCMCLEDVCQCNRDPGPANDTVGFSIQDGALIVWAEQRLCTAAASGAKGFTTVLAKTFLGIPRRRNSVDLDHQE